MKYSIIWLDEWRDGDSARSLITDDAEHLIFADRDIELNQSIIDLLLSPLQSSLAATSSPLPNDSASTVRVHTPLPLPAPALEYPNPRLVAVSKDCLRLVSPSRPLSWHAWIDAVVNRTMALGFSHLGAPGLALRGAKPPLASDPYFETHLLASDVAFRPVTVAIDGSCLLQHPTTGTHHLILQLTKALAQQLPAIAITVVAPKVAYAYLNRFFEIHSNVEVCDKSQFGDRVADICYRPYQMYTVKELLWCRRHSRRFMISQLDMISFNNASYYPRRSLFHEIRNLTRATLRMADGVTFISRFGIQSTTAHIGGIDPERIFLVPCGTDHVQATGFATKTSVTESEPFVLCLSGTFAHKNRPFATNVFGELRKQGYRGKLLLVGSTPYYGAAEELEREAQSALSQDALENIRELGVVSEATKWALLSSADAVLYPSIVEGFGLVPFEAAQMGTPTLTHRSSALEEILGDAQQQTTWDAPRWADTIMSWLNDSELAQRQVDAIQRAGRLLTWNRSAQELVRAIHATLQMPRSMPKVGVSEGPRSVQYPTLRDNAKIANRAVRFARRAFSYMRRRVSALTH